jgi:hypothetical protein
MEIDEGEPFASWSALLDMTTAIVEAERNKHRENV